MFRSGSGKVHPPRERTEVAPFGTSAGLNQGNLRSFSDLIILNSFHSKHRVCPAIYNSCSRLRRSPLRVDRCRSHRA